MAFRKPNFFVDTNVFVDYLLASETIKELDNRDALYTKIKTCRDFFEAYFKNYLKIRLCTSFLNLNEIPNAFIEKLVKGRMYRQDLAFNYFEKYKKDFLRSPAYKKEVKAVLRRYYKFLKVKKIWFIYGLLIKKSKHLKEIDWLQIEFNLKLADALIFFIAQKEGGFFVTQDSDFLNNKQLKEKYKSRIQIISPAAALQKFNEIL